MKRLLLFSILLAFTIFSCTKKEESVKLEADTPAYQLAKELTTKLAFLDPDTNNVLLSTNKFDITSGDIIQYIKSNFGKRTNQLVSMKEEQLKQIIEQNVKELAEKKMLMNAAKKANTVLSQAEVDSVLNLQYLHSGGEEKFLEMLTNAEVSLETVRNAYVVNLTVQRYLDKILASEFEVKEEEIQTAYLEDKTASVRHILLNTSGKSDSAKQEINKKMAAILDQAKKGEDFAELAKKYSEDPGSKINGGLYENFGRGKMVKPFEEAAFSLPVGEISDIVETQFGYHIIKVIERKKETRPLEEIRGSLEASLQKKKHREAIQTCVSQLREKEGYELADYF